MYNDNHCFVCDGEATKKDRINGQYSLCNNPQCETDLDNYLADMEAEDEPEPDPDEKWKQDHEDPMP